MHLPVDISMEDDPMKSSSLRLHMAAEHQVVVMTLGLYVIRVSSSLVPYSLILTRKRFPRS
jgi:hypothetical protein